MKRFRNIGLIVLSAALALSLSACGSSKSTTSGSYYDAAMPETAAAMASGSYGVNNKVMMAEEAAYDYEASAMEAGAAPAAGQYESYETKLIKNVNVSLSTSSFDDLVGGIKTKITELGGYVESSSLYDNNYSNSRRFADITARIPQTRLQEFLDTAFVNGKITSINEYVEDVTLQYADLDTKVKSLEVEQARLLELMEKAEDIETIIALEERLANLRYEIDSIKSNLKYYDNKVTYSTVYISISEVAVVTAGPKAGILERISTGFVESTGDFFEGLGDFVVWFASRIIIIVFTVAVIFGIFKLIAFIIKRNRAKRETNGEVKAKKDKKEKKGVFGKKNENACAQADDSAATRQEEGAAATSEDEKNV
ncbi:MAG: DUF4349 domain-containing protein [Eubacteriales bacterium]|nr:DUF4349 domain-containing protein [Eubacteriales bacterium]